MSLNPMHWIATLFGLGLIPHIGGVITSLIAIIIGAAIAHFAGINILILATIVVTFIGLIAASIYVKTAGGPEDVVIDELAGVWILLLLCNYFGYPLNFAVCLCAFICFVIFDLAKPWPIGETDQHIGGGFGIMLDDIIAAIYAFAGMAVLIFFYVKLLA